MPRRYRIAEAGYYHCISRGVERRNVFIEADDYDMFLVILGEAKRDFQIIIHAYCLMTNHYHLLIETTLPNISIVMQQLNSRYSIYFNKKYKRNGHLWQGRFYSCYLYDERHFWYAAKYIERNPIKAAVVDAVNEYVHQSYYQRKSHSDFFSLIEGSKTFDMTVEEYGAFISTDLDDDVLSKIYDSPRVLIKDGKAIFLYKRIDTFFDQDRDTNRMNNAKAAYEYGYTVSEIADYLGLSHTAVSKYVKIGA